MFSDAGVARFGTADGSPQVGFQWEIAGLVKVPNAKLEDLKLWTDLFIASVDDGEESPDMLNEMAVGMDMTDHNALARKVVAELSDAMVLVQNAPVSI